MKVSAINNPNFNKVVETFRKEGDNKEVAEDKDVYETTITYTETVKAPKNDKTLQKIDYMI